MVGDFTHFRIRPTQLDQRLCVAQRLRATPPVHGAMPEPGVHECDQNHEIPA